MNFTRKIFPEVILHLLERENINSSKFGNQNFQFSTFRFDTEMTTALYSLRCNIKLFFFIVLERDDASYLRVPWQTV